MPALSWLMNLDFAGGTAAVAVATPSYVFTANSRSTTDTANARSMTHTASARSMTDTADEIRRMNQ